MDETRPTGAPGDRLLVPVADVLRVPALSRRRFLHVASIGGLAGFAGLGAVGSLLTACGGDTKSQSGGSSSGANLPATLKVGVIVPQSGIAAFLGDIVGRSLDAAKRHIDRAQLIKGTTVSYDVVNAPAEEGADATQRAYNRLAADPDVIGIVWAAPSGLLEALPQITRDQMPVMAVYFDLYSMGKLDRAATPTVFQMLPPTRWLLDTMAQYAVQDRGYRTAATLVDTTVQTGIDAWTREAATAAGLQVVSEQTFSLFSADYGAQLQDLKGAAPQCVFTWGLVDNMVGIVKQLAALDAAYVDTPTAKSGNGWHPQLFCNSGGIERTFAEKAGSAARPGTVASWYLRGNAVGAQSQDNIRDWMLAEGLGEPTGGEEGAADAWWALLEAVRQAGSADRAKVVAKLSGLRTRFASLDFTLDAETHVGMTRDDISMLTVEGPTPVPSDPPYAPPAQIGMTVGADFVGPFQLNRPTLEANKRAQPEYMKWALEHGWGVLCTVHPPDARSGDVVMTKDCKIH